MPDIPARQYGVQLIGPDELILNKQKPVFLPGPHQVLARVEAVGLCFSDLKLLRQFSAHVRKGPIISGIEPKVLEEIPSYVPGDEPTVPGHESVVIIEAVGEGVERFGAGGRYLVETDYRWLPTEGSNAAFGYNFEGALQEYVLMDERVITSPEGWSMLIPAPQGLSASEIALVEPFACVEHSYTAEQRRTINPDGEMLVAVDVEVDGRVFQKFFGRFGRPKRITWLCRQAPPRISDIVSETVEDVLKLPAGGFDDVIYFGSEASRAELLFEKLGAGGLFNIVLCGGRFERDVVVPAGRIHYSAIRLIGTCGFDPAESMKHIPDTGEIRPRDKINIVGAAGPMGMMHILRNISSGKENIEIFAGDIDEERLKALGEIAVSPAQKKEVSLELYNPDKQQLCEAFDYVVLMAPVPELVDGQIKSCGRGAIINIFAGIGGDVTTAVCLNDYIEKQLYFVGTSGSVLQDMQRVLGKVAEHRIEPNLTIAAVSGLAGAVDAIKAVEGRSAAGKIIVYPACRDLPLIKLSQMKEKMPQVAELMSGGLWTKLSEHKLLQKCQ